MSSGSWNVSPGSVGETFHKRWEEYAKRYHRAIFLLYGWVPVCIGLYLASRFGLHQPLLALLLMMIWLVAALTAVWWAGQFRCPRCSRRYGALGHKRRMNVTRGLFDDVCSNCKLAKFGRIP